MNKQVVIYTGGESFSEIIRDGACYVDKTSYLKTLFESNSVKNILFTRPRRFGKTLNMSMIEDFCSINYMNPGDKSYQQKLFIENGRKLSVSGKEYYELCSSVMGEHPVISVSFKGVEGECFYRAVQQLIYKVSLLYNKFVFLQNSSRQDPLILRKFREEREFCIEKQDKLYRHEYLERAISIISTFIPRLAGMLYIEYGRQVLVIIDEYDVPLQKAVIAKQPYYDEMLSIIKNLSSNTFKKDNEPWLFKGIITGCLRIAHQSIFTDANNFTTYDMNDDPYTGFFGFTEDETVDFLKECKLPDRVEEVKEWYDGYHFGKNHVFCPWSLACFCNAALENPDIKARAYWVNTSGNDIITLFTRNSMEAHDAGNISRMQQLLNKESVNICLKEFTVYPDISSRMSFDVFMTLMLNTGYVTYAGEVSQDGKVAVKIPNKEVLRGFQEKFEYLYSEDNLYWFNLTIALIDLLMDNKVDDAAKLISAMLKQYISVRNSGSEYYYHGFLLGILSIASSSRGIELDEEMETGIGYSDIILRQGRTAVILEIKKGDNSLNGRINASKSAVDQIIKKDYAGVLIKQEYINIFGLGIGFGGKDCVIQSLGNLAINSN